MDYEQEPSPQQPGAPSDPQRPGQPVYLRPVEPPARRPSLARRILMTLFAVVFLMSAMLNVALLGLLATQGQLAAGTRGLKEVYVQGDKEAVRKIAVIHVSGVIFKDSNSMGGDAFSYAMAAINKARKDKSVAAVVIEVNSPGGGVGASDELHHEIVRLAKNKKVVVHFEDMAASGGYYISAPAHRILASPTCITGSIGVRISGMNLMGLAQKLGVEMKPITSGAHKDILSPWRAMTEEEHKMLKDIVMELHGKFRQVILDGRKDRLTADELSTLDDGRIFTASQALKAKLVDAIGYSEDAIVEAQKIANLGPEAQVVRYEKQKSLLQTLLSAKSASVEGYSVKLMQNLIGREPFLYLWMMPQEVMGR